MSVAQFIHGAYPSRSQYRRVGNFNGNSFHKLLIDACEVFPFYFDNIIGDCNSEIYKVTENDSYLLPDDYGMLHECTFDDLYSMSDLLIHIGYECKIPITEIGNIQYDGNKYVLHSSGYFEMLESPEIKYYTTYEYVVKERNEDSPESIEEYSYIGFKEVSNREQMQNLIVELIDINGVPHKYKYDVLMKHLHKKYKPIIYDKIEKGEIEAEFDFGKFPYYAKPFNEFCKLFDGVPPHIQDIKRAIKNKTIDTERLMNELNEIEIKREQRRKQKREQRRKQKQEQKQEKEQEQKQTNE